MKKFIRKIISTALVCTMLFSFCGISSSALSEEDMSKEGVELGYSILNGYSKLRTQREGLSFTQNTAVYCGLDISSPYIMLCGGWFYIKNGVDLERISTDNAYAMDILTRLDSYLAKKGIENERAQSFKEEYFNSDKEIILSLDTVGIYIFEAENQESLKLMNNEYIDFVLVGGGVPKTLKDLNLDGECDYMDAVQIQKYVCEIISKEDSDEAAYLMYASDINGDRKIDVKDATELTRRCR